MVVHYGNRSGGLSPSEKSKLDEVRTKNGVPVKDDFTEDILYIRDTSDDGDNKLYKLVGDQVVEVDGIVDTGWVDLDLNDPYTGHIKYRAKGEIVEVNMDIGGDGGDGDTAATLPNGVRPAEAKRVPITECDSDDVYVEIGTDGVIKVYDRYDKDMTATTSFIV